MSDTIQIDTTIPDVQILPDTNPSSTVQIPVIEAPESILAVDQLDGPSLASTLKLPETSPQYLSPSLPVAPTPHVFSLADLREENGELDLGPDVALSDISVAPDGSFIETSSGPTAHILKRRYDQLAGVGPSVRSPYAITAFVNQHGKSMYRIGHRGKNSAPAASAADADDLLAQPKNSSDASHSPRTQRRSRLSMHFLQPGMFAKTSIPPTSRPPIVSNTPSISKKLRKTRSIPDMSSSEPTITSAPTFAVTGRGHSQSVTAMDIPRLPMPFASYPPPRPIDAFAELLDWFNPLTSTADFSNQSLFTPDTSSPDAPKTRPTVPQPFGPNVVFKSPAIKVAPNPPPRHLREMQSFESGRTARQCDSQESLPGSDSPVPSSDDASGTAGERSRPASAIRLSLLSEVSIDSDTHSDPPAEAEPDVAPMAEGNRLSTQYSTEVFNVLQTYRGLPMFEKLVPEIDNDNVIKLSLAADQSAAPRDDPRFVLWGETQVESEADDFNSKSRDSLTDVSSSNPSSSISKRRSSKVSKFKSPDASAASLPKQGQRVLLAATIERWIAQLTSDLNYDELLNFFLTYRTYVPAVDLCHLFICRFHWALQTGASRQDETVRRIVRVRTFVAIRYWLLTFFTVDFIPNRELRLLIADWLNTLIEDPILKKHSDATDIVKRLIKVAKECKRAHIRTEKPKENKSSSDNEERPVDHLLGKSFAEAIRKLPQEDHDSILDLDFLPDEAKTEELSGFPIDSANAHLTAGAVGGTVLSPNRPSSLPLSSFNILQRTDHAPGPSADVDLPFVENTAPVLLGHHHSALSRAFVRTIGRLGRWKRVLNQKSAVRPANTLGACGVGDQAFDLDLNAARDLLTVNGGVENYLRMVEPPAPRPSSSEIIVAPLESHSRTPSLLVLPPLPSAPPTPSVPLSTANIYPSSQLSSSPLSSHVNASPAPDTTATTTIKTESPTSISSPLPEPSESSPPPSFVESVQELNELSPDPVVSQDEACAGPIESAPETSEIHRLSPASFNYDTHGLREPDRPESFMSSSTDSFGAILTADGPLPPTFPGQHNQWSFDTSIDDLDLSDTSSLPGGSDLPAPPGLMRPARRLPNRRDFEFVRRSEVSSMGFSNEYMRDSVASSTHSQSSPSSSGLPQPISRWQMKTLQRTFESMSNDGEDGGDVEAALRRLEGQINPKIQQEKAEKVDGWVRSMQERLRNGDYDYESSIFSEDDVEGFIDEVYPATDDTDPESPPDLVVSSSETDDSNDNDDRDGMPRTPIPSQSTQQLPFPPGLEPIARNESQKPPPEPAVPEEILQSRLPPIARPAFDSISPPTESIFSSKFSSESTHSIHRSFILNYSAEQLAEHFSMIDRELFMGVKFEELVTGEWIYCQEINVYEWAQYLKDRARWKAEQQFPEKTTALAAVRARFNLMVSFVISEVVLTPPTERHIVVSKFLRIAWKCYSLSNFNTLTAIIMALKDEWVARAMKRQGWNRIGVFEARVFKDLKIFITVADHFKFMRQIVDSIVDAKPLEGSSHAASVISGGDSQSGKGRGTSDNRPMVPTACIPFIGIYLSQLRVFTKLPGLIDATAPHLVVGIDPVHATFDPPAHPEVFSALVPLPKSMHLEPLINVHKQRRIADVIKALVAGQHLASRVQFSIDKRLFQKCLRLRGLQPDLLQRALAMYPE
ncbi:Guanine nucleotide exchange factor LTE1 [Psilocybe cubensis]|uniref:Ras GEF n=2 Tax=Psilocybe cubensis TaxID=181762 RepID=A0A8H8CF81_PSICU|nr:Guanine nucleotide exchange factor LTE1 [Psilocybe cubensis]KAH9477116.1 Guanine nucleotide exchange factor LTE1 [Psilocybe cubensis]